MTALADLTRADRQRLAERLAELGELAQLMRESGNLPPAPEPVPLHRAGRETSVLSTEDTNVLSAAAQRTTAS
jgi:hypothetical protein